jgi:hypothetical protein
VAVFDGEEWETFTPQNSLLPMSRVLTVLQDKRDRLWVGSESGVSVYDREKEKWKSFTSKAHRMLPGNARVLRSDDNGRLWVGTEQGVSVYQEGVWQTFTAKNNALAPGLIHALLADDRGWLWAGTEKGVSVCRHQGDPPWIFFTDWAHKDACWECARPFGSETRLVSLPLYNDGLRIGFLGGDMESHPDNIRYRYQMKGYDRGWIISADNTAAYPRLGPGSHTFVVEAIDGDGNFSPAAELTVEVSVLPFQIPDSVFTLSAIVLVIMGTTFFGAPRLRHWRKTRLGR